MRWEGIALLVNFVTMGFFLGIVPLFTPGVSFSVKGSAGWIYIVFAAVKIWLVLRITGKG